MLAERCDGRSSRLDAGRDASTRGAADPAVREDAGRRGDVVRRMVPERPTWPAIARSSEGAERRPGLRPIAPGCGSTESRPAMPCSPAARGSPRRPTASAVRVPEPVDPRRAGRVLDDAAPRGLSTAGTPAPERRARRALRAVRSAAPGPRRQRAQRRGVELRAISDTRRHASRSSQPGPCGTSARSGRRRPAGPAAPRGARRPAARPGPAPTRRRSPSPRSRRRGRGRRRRRRCPAGRRRRAPAAAGRRGAPGR